MADRLMLLAKLRAIIATLIDFGDADLNDQQSAQLTHAVALLVRLEKDLEQAADEGD